ncbi:hypothetical protein CK203_100549 [Vitis vinifera]|uniref:Glycine-rich protein n=1 Tax=Vitis vinifera TaxID=29760 RepID=A0A438FIW3_VITVI|nr:hypothetical protein CK203_100549 [Vitis vinifera]
MGSKAFVFLALLWAVLLLISSEVAARDLAETSTEQERTNVHYINLIYLKTAAEAAAKTNGVDDAKYPGNGGPPAMGYGDPGGENGGYPGGGNGGYPGHGREAVEAETKAKPQN